MGDQYYVDDYGEEPDMEELEDYMSPDEGDGDLAGFERPEMKVDFSTAVVVSNLPKVRSQCCVARLGCNAGGLAYCSGTFANVYCSSTATLDTRFLIPHHMSREYTMKRENYEYPDEYGTPSEGQAV